MSLRRLAAALVAVVVTATPAARTQETPTKGIENFEKRFPPAEKNAAAEELEQLALLLGIDFHQDDAEAQHPSREDLDANRQAGFGSWLDAQLMVADDSIAPLPGKLRDFLDKRQRVIGRIAGLLGREAPEWAPAVRESANRIPPMFVVISLEKILFSAALVEERAGRHGQTGDLLEASWSLGRSLTKQPDLTSQLIAVAVARLQAGALRKISDPPIQWLDRMSGDEPREGILEALEDVPMLSHRGDLSLDSFTAALVRAWRAAADRVRTLSPCEVSKLSSEEIWKPASEEVEKWKEAGGDPQLQIANDNAWPNLTAAVRRAGRALVDRELTAKILELRLEKAASRDGRWPQKFFDSESRVCPGSAYQYQARGAAMSIRFTGSIDEPASAGALSLPLVFEVRPPVPTRTSTRSGRPTATPPPRS